MSLVDKELKFVCRLRNVSNIKKLNIIMTKWKSIFISYECVYTNNIQKILFLICPRTNSSTSQLIAYEQVFAVQAKNIVENNK